MSDEISVASSLNLSDSTEIIFSQTSFSYDYSAAAINVQVPYLAVEFAYKVSKVKVPYLLVEFAYKVPKIKVQNIFIEVAYKGTLGEWQIYEV